MRHPLLLTLFFAFFLGIGSVFAQTTLTGKITAANGEPIIGALVMEVDGAKGVLTDLNGDYTLTVTGLDKKIKVTFTGYAPLIAQITGRKVLNLILAESTRSTGEVVVTAAGIERQTRSLGYGVQTVDGDALVKARETNVVQSLAGKIAGVQVTQSAGTPGASSSIRIRGTNSLTGDYEPLFVIDGIPIDNSQTNTSNDPSLNNTLDGVSTSNRAIDLNSSDIESVSVLKGPSATALYGIRAGNGAIIITTKKGKRGSGKLNVNYSADFKVDVVNKLPSLQNTFSQGVNGSYRDPSTGQRASWGARLDTLRYDGISNPFDKNGNIIGVSEAAAGAKTVTPYDNTGDFFQRGRTWDHNISLSGGGENSTFFGSIGHLDQQGIIPNTEFKRTSFRFTTEQYLTQDFKVTASANYINSQGRRSQQGSNLSGIMLGLLRTPPSFDNSNGLGKDAVDNPSAYLLDPFTQRNYRGGGGYDNPFYTVNGNPFRDQTNRLIGFLQGDYKMADWAKLTYRVGIDSYDDTRKGGFDIPSRAYPGGRVFEDKIVTRDITSDLILNLNKEFANGLAITGNFGHNYFTSQTSRVYSQADGLNTPGLFAIANGNTFFVQQSASQLERMGLYGDITLSYKQRYYLNITGRNDWSSTLEKNNNSFFYPSVSAGYVFTEDLGLNDNPYFSFGKLRASVAQVGRDAPVYSTRNQYGLPSIADGFTDGIKFPYNGYGGYFFGMGNGSSYSTMSNGRLKPEMNTTLELGTELAFFQNRLKLDVTLYRSQNKDQIVAVNTPTSSGVASAVLNAGKLENKGIELSLSGNVIEKRDFTWTTVVNYTRNVSKVLYLPPGADKVQLVGFAGVQSYAIAGQPYGVIYGTDYLKASNGTLILGEDSLPIFNPTPSVIGNPNPTFLLSWRNSFTYKNWNLSFMWDGRFGGQIWNGTRGAINYFGTGGETSTRETETISYTGYLQDATQPGGYDPTKTVTKTIRKDQDYYVNGPGDGFNNINSLYMEDATWVRLRDISLTYSLPSAALRGTRMSAVSLSLYCRNALLITKYKGVDPETNLTGTTNGFGLDYFNNPNTRSYGLNLRVSF